MFKEDISYKKSGVDIDKADRIIKEIKRDVGSNIGLFGGMFDLADVLKKYENPVLVSSTDGIGSKLDLLVKFKKWETAAIDLVAMNLNDIVCLGARPLFFMDYIGAGSLSVSDQIMFINNLSEVLAQYNCKLIGGELAELPSVFQKGKLDIAGFVVGVVEKEKILKKEKVKEGDLLIAIPSNGIHSNGYSLVNYIINAGLLNEEEKLLAPTKIIVNQTMAIKDYINAVSHITGGGIPGNLNRIVPDGLQAFVEYNIQIPEIFKKIMKSGIKIEEMFNVFNMGIAAIYVVSEQNKNKVIDILKKVGEIPYIIGSIQKQNDFNVKSNCKSGYNIIFSKDKKVKICYKLH